MQTDLFDYPLPSERIALRPACPRDQARLLVIHKDNLRDIYIKDFPSCLRAGDLLVINDSPTMPARLYGGVEGKKTEILLCTRKQDCWRVMARPAKNLQPGKKIIFTATISAEIIASNLLRFCLSEEEFDVFLDQEGEMPLPPYIAKRRAADDQDRHDYKTIYQKQDGLWGSIAAPTAGLHFTKNLFAALEERGIEIMRLTLHVGEGTFRPVRVADIENHRMLPERGLLSAENAAHLNETKARGGRIIAVGTTSLRLLEAASDESGFVSLFDGKTDLFIVPGYRFKAADAIMTNFHLPCSTPLMLAAAMAGLDNLKRAYAHALARDYRFFSYGDACLIWR